MAFKWAMTMVGGRGRPWRLAACVAGLCFLLGCRTVQTKVVNRQAGPPVPSYHEAVGGIPFRRVAILPLCSEGEATLIPREMDEAFNAELTKTSLFELIRISHSQMQEMFGTPQVSSVDTLPGDLLAQMMTRYNVDAVLFTDVTHYFPYQPIAIGMRSKLVDARTGEIRWAFDYLFDSGKPAIAEAAKTYFLQNSQTNLPIQADGSSILQSPLRFSGFVAWEAYRSLLNQPVAPGKNVLNSRTYPPM